MKNPLLLASILVLSACSTLTPTQKAIVVNAETIAQIAGSAAATYYGGPVAGQAASAGLSALASVMNGYIGTTIPSSIVAATPGVEGVGDALAAQINPNATITVKDVALVNQAAKLVTSIPLVTTGTNSL